MNYKFNDNTLLHAVAFNPFKLESILQNGIISFNEASNSKLPFTRNTFIIKMRCILIILMKYLLKIK